MNKYKRIVKITIISILSLILLGIIGIVVLVTCVNPNRFKPIISSAVNHATGRNLTISGDISWTIYPHFGVKVVGVTLSNPEGFTNSPFLTLQSASISVALMPLLAHKIDVNSLEVNGLNLGLIKQGDKNNWTFNSDNKESNVTKKSSEKPEMNFELEKLNLSHITFTYDDVESKIHQSIKDVSFTMVSSLLGGLHIKTGKTSLVDLNNISFNFNNLAIGEINFKVESFDNPVYGGTIKITRLAVNGLSQTVGIPIPQLANSSLLNNLIFSSEINGDLNNITIKNLSFNSDTNLTLTANATVNNFDNPKFNGNITVPDFSLNKILDGLHIAESRRKDMPVLNHLAFNGNFSGTRQSIILDQFNFKSGELVGGIVNLNLESFANPHYKGNLNLSKFALNKVLDGLNIAKAARSDKPLLNNVTVSSNFNGNKDSINLNNLNFKFGGFIQGVSNLAVQNFTNPNFSGDIKLPEFSLNKVLDGANIAKSARSGKVLLNGLSFDTRFSGNTDSFSLTGANFKFSNYVQGQMDIKVQNFANPNFSGAIKVPNFSLNKVLDGLKIAESIRQDKPLLNNFALAGQFSGTKNSINLSGFNLQVGKMLQAYVNMQVQNFSDPSFSGDLKLPEFPLNQVLNQLNIANKVRQDKPILNSLAFSSHISGTKDSLSLKGYNITVGNLVSASGNIFNVQNFTNPKVSGDITVPGFSLTKVMQASSITVPKIPNPGVFNDVELRTQFAGSKTNLALNQLYFRLSKSVITANVNVVSFIPLALSQYVVISSIDLADFSDFNNLKVLLNNVQLKGNLSIKESQLATLNGSQDLKIGNIKVLGFSLGNEIDRMNKTINAWNLNSNLLSQMTAASNVAQMIQQTKADFAKIQSPGPKDLSKQTDFGSLSSNAIIKSGIVNPSSFKLDGPLLAVNGDGSLNLLQKTLNYKVNGKLLAPNVNPLFKKLTIPISIKGTFADHETSVDWISVQKQLIQYVIEANAEMIKSAVKQNVQNVINNQLKQSVPSGGSSNGGGTNQIINNVSKSAAEAIGNIFGH